MRRKDDNEVKTLEELWATVDIIDDSHTMPREKAEMIEIDLELQKKLEEVLKKKGLL